MKVYIAAPYPARELAKIYADELASIGIECTSTWVTETVEINEQSTGSATGLTDKQVKQHVTTDLHDIRRADVLVHLTALHAFRAAGLNGTADSPTLNSGGRHVELGFALALNKHIINVGYPENVFHRGRANNVAGWHEAVLALVQIKDRLQQEARQA